MTTAVYRVKRTRARLRLFTARTTQNDELFDDGNSTLVFKDLSFRRHTKKAHGIGAVGGNVAWFFSYALKLTMYGRRFD